MENDMGPNKEIYNRFNIPRPWKDVEQPFPTEPAFQGEGESCFPYQDYAKRSGKGEKAQAIAPPRGCVKPTQQSQWSAPQLHGKVERKRKVPMETGRPNASDSEDIDSEVGEITESGVLGVGRASPTAWA